MRSYFHQQITREPNHTFLVSLLRACTSFGAEGFRKEVWERLTAAYPISSFPCNVKAPPLVDLLWVIQSARLIRGDVLLPAALYYLSMYPLETILSTRTTIPRLSRHYLNECLLGREKLIEKNHAIVWGCGQMWASDKHEPKAICLSVTAAFVSSKEGCKLMASPFIYSAYPGRLASELCRCKICPQHFRGSLEILRQMVWKELPSYFGLGSWERLREASSRHLEELDQTV